MNLKSNFSDANDDQNVTRKYFTIIQVKWSKRFMCDENEKKNRTTLPFEPEFRQVKEISKYPFKK